MIDAVESVVVQWSHGALHADILDEWTIDKLFALADDIMKSLDEVESKRRK